VKNLLGYFIKGLLVFVPAALTVTIIVWVIRAFDGLLNLPIPGLGSAIAVAIITLIGFLASNYFGNKFFALIDQVFIRLPVVKLLYAAIKDFTNALAGEKRSFDKPVLVEIISGGPKVLGFITREDLSMFALSEHVAVYLPQSYNFAGQVLIFPSDRVNPLDIESSKVMAFIVSGGVLGKQ
jgi:uncharacterized membrane protein